MNRALWQALGGLQKGLRLIPDPEHLMMERQKEIAGIPNVMGRCPQWSLNQVLGKREEEEFNSDEGKRRGGGYVVAKPWRANGMPIGGKR